MLRKLIVAASFMVVLPLGSAQAGARVGKSIAVPVVVPAPYYVPYYRPYYRPYYTPSYNPYPIFYSPAPVYTGLGPIYLQPGAPLYALPQSELLVKYTFYGDADLNGVVDFDDYSRIDSGFSNGGTDWLHGDFDYNGQVDFDDYSRIDMAFNTQFRTLRRAMSYLNGEDRSDVGMNLPALRMVQSHFEQFGIGYANSFLNAVPEPTSLAVLALAGSILGSRSRRRLRR